MSRGGRHPKHVDKLNDNESNDNESNDNESNESNHDEDECDSGECDSDKCAGSGDNSSDFEDVNSDEEDSSSDSDDDDSESVSSYDPGELLRTRENDVFESSTARYTIVRRLGAGQFSRVWCAVREIKTGAETQTNTDPEEPMPPLEFRALKICRSDETYRMIVNREVEFMRYLGGHDHILRLEDVFEVPGLGGMHHPVLVTAACGMDLFRLIHLHSFRRSDRRMPLPVVRVVARQMLEGLAHMAARGVVHTDLKPENVLLDMRFEHRSEVDPDAVHVRIADFGSSIRPDKGDLVKPYGHTLEYRPPELIWGEKKVTPAVDMWSAGCIVWDMVHGNHLFSPRNSRAYEGRRRSTDISSETSMHTNLEHLALMVEVLGPFPRTIGRRVRGDFFNARGELKGFGGETIPRVHLRDLLENERSYDEEIAKSIENFILPMFRFNPRVRATPRQMLGASFLLRTEDPR